MPRSSAIPLALAVALCLGLARPSDAQSIGPDVIVDEIDVIYKWGSILNLTAYSFSTTSCNIGDIDAPWFEFTNEHPVISCNMYRLENGRFEQIGISWLKHGFCALSQPGCGTCAPSGCEILSVGCRDTYGSQLNGQQAGLGPRYEVNAATGEFPYPFDTIGVTGPVNYKRIQVQQSDLDPTLHPTATYLYESQ
ncbi:MAG: hypothetical protein KDC38_19400, partial [Planctomycetes bacterium]|nr:hypothetical protein [Planctomycetota bacterium]